MYGDNESFDTVSKRMDDDFNKTAKKMAITSIIGYIIILVVLGLVAVGFLYLIKVWFFGGF